MTVWCCKSRETILTLYGHLRNVRREIGTFFRNFLIFIKNKLIWFVSSKEVSFLVSWFRFRGVPFVKSGDLKFGTAEIYLKGGLSLWPMES